MMQAKKRIGRPIESRTVRVTPEFRKEPDVAKMVHALIAIAEKMVQEKTKKQEAA